MTLGLSISVFAGNLNENEVNAINKLTEQSTEIKLDEKYINQLRNHFYSDGIDLTKNEVESFLEYTQKGMKAFNKYKEEGIEFDTVSDAYINLEKAGAIVGIYLEYDSAANCFYGIDYVGHMVIDSQPIIKDTDQEDDETDWNISIEIIFAIAVSLCILGLYANARRWNRKIRKKHDKEYEEDDEDEDEMEVANRKTRKARLQTLSYRSVKQVLKYFYIPIIMGLIVVAIGFAYTQVNVDLRESFFNSFINTQPLYTQNNDNFVPTNIKEEEQETQINADSFSWPSYGDRYGTLECEKLEIKAPVYYGDRGSVLVDGAGTYIGSAIPGMQDTILIGAHDTTYFAGLENVEKDDEFVFTTEYGIYKYKVIDIKIYDKDKYAEAYDLTSEKEQLVLYTCYPFGKLNGTKTERMFVYLDKVSGPELN